MPYPKLSAPPGDDAGRGSYGTKDLPDTVGTTTTPTTARARDSRAIRVLRLCVRPAQEQVSRHSHEEVQSPTSVPRLDN